MPIQQQGQPQQFYDPQQITGIPMGQPAQPVYQQPPQSTMEAMNQQQQQYGMYNAQVQQQPQQQAPNQIRITAEEFNKRVNDLAEDKFRIRQQEVANNAVYAMKGVLNNMGFFNGNNNQQQQMPNQPSFWNSTTGDIAKVGIGGAIGIGAFKVFQTLRGSSGCSGGYCPSSDEMNLVGEAIKTIFRK